MTLSGSIFRGNLWGSLVHGRFACFVGGLDVDTSVCNVFNFVSFKHLCR